MSEKFKNVVCEPDDVIEGIKRQIFEFISLKQTTCNNLPNLQIPSTLPDVPNLNPSQAVIDFLNDILSVLSGINFDEMRMQLINWLVEQLSPLAKDLSFNLKSSLVKCYVCKIEPTIPGWLFQTQPGTTQPGIGYNVELNKIDLSCLFAANPNSSVGELFYDGDKDSDMNAFLWEVIQENGNPLTWKDPLSGKEIAEFRYYEDSVLGFVESSGTPYQDIEQKPRLFNVRIMDSYQDKSLVTFINDYFNSQNPLLDVDKVIPNVVDLIYGTLTNKIKLPDECLNKVVEFEKSIEDYINNGGDNAEVVFDESFYDFNADQIKNIKRTVSQKKLGLKQFNKCCGKQTSSISFETLDNINKDIKSTSNLQEKISAYSRSMDRLIDESTVGVKNLDINNASAEFLANFITSLQIALTKMVLSPKNLLLVNMLYFLVNGVPIKEVNIKKILKEYECVIRDIIRELIRKLIYEYLLPLVIKALKNLIICYITKKIKEENLQFIKSISSLIPGKITEKLEKANELFGKAKGAADKLSDFTEGINLNALNNINIQSTLGKKGRFCD
jgi:hypothetical protein|tara:strand:- start:1740 stop:3410 length:1671 start_codon:yes stop_codon:yes gene_type:complete